MDKNIPRWIKSSVVKWFSDQFSNNDLYFYLEGCDRRTDTKRQYVEFRLDGPYSRELSHNYWEFAIDIDILIVTIRNETDIYEHDRGIGLVCAAFVPGIPVWKYGDTSDDDPTVQVGCLRVIPKDQGRIVVTNFGQVRNDSRLLQSTVEAYYKLNLRT